MKKLCFLLITILVSARGICQDKTNLFSFFAGSHYSLNNGIYNQISFYDCYVGSNIKQNTKLSGVHLYDAGFLFRYSVFKSRFAVSLGLSYSQKGFTESGQVRLWNEPDWHNYTEKIISDFAGVYAGLSFKLVEYKKTKLYLGELLNLERNLTWFNQKTFTPGAISNNGCSFRTFLSLEYKAGNKLSVFMSPFYHVSVYPYNFDAVHEQNNFKPMSAGISCGIMF